MTFLRVAKSERRLGQGKHLDLQQAACRCVLVPTSNSRAWSKFDVQQHSTIGKVFRRLFCAPLLAGDRILFLRFFRKDVNYHARPGAQSHIFAGKGANSVSVKPYSRIRLGRASTPAGAR